MARSAHLGDELSALLDDELDDESLRAALAHLRGCGRCRDEFQALRRLREGLRGVTTPAPHLAHELHAALLVPSAIEAGHRERHLGAAGGAAVAAAAGIVLVLGVAFAVGSDSGAVTPDVDRLVVDHMGSVDGGPVLTPAQLTPVGG